MDAKPLSHKNFRKDEMPLKIIKKYTIGDGLPFIVDTKKSHGSWVVDTDGREYLDCYSQFASQPLGWNHPKLVAAKDRLTDAAIVKIANSDMYCQEYAEFLQAFSDITPDFKHYFFIDGGTLAVENAIKAAFDWKIKKYNLYEWKSRELSVIHLEEAFHGRSGYTLSLTNTLPVKTLNYPKFNWPRIINPKILSHIGDTAVNEMQSLNMAEHYLKTGNVAAIILEPIQGEGGDNHFRNQYLQELYDLSRQYDAMFILDEVQTGVGLTGKMWAYEHFTFKPDMICFGKKVQTCGFCANEKIDEVENNVFKESGRINSTWGGNIVDMVRFTVIIKIIKEENLVDNAAKVGDYLVSKLQELPLKNVRGKGLMIAFSFNDTEKRNKVIERLSSHMLVLKSGLNSIRLRPSLDFSFENADKAVEFIGNAIGA
jgi:L-lysine 6-transaminase